MKNAPMPLMNQHLACDAILTIRNLAYQGKIGFPQPWINRDGVAVVPWDPDVDGDVIDCYIDMFGLNGREPRETKEGRIEYEKWREQQRAGKRGAAYNEWLEGQNPEG